MNFMIVSIKITITFTTFSEYFKSNITFFHFYNLVLRSLHSTWGKGKWKFDPIFPAKINPSEGKVANNDDDSISSSNLSLNLLRKELVEWNDA